MCGRYNITDDPFVQDLLEELGTKMHIQPRYNIAARDIYSAARKLERSFPRPFCFA